MSDDQSEHPVWKQFILQHKLAASGAVVAFFLYIYDLWGEKTTVASLIATVCVIIFFYLDSGMTASRHHEATLAQLGDVRKSIDNNSAHLQSFQRVFQQHEHVFLHRTIDKIKLISFNNLLIYLPFYLAQDLGYFTDEHIEIAETVGSLNDATTAHLLTQNSRDAIALCDPYMCIIHQDLQMVYPVCQGVAAWPMTLNWIGTAQASKGPVQIAAYKAPSTTHVLAQLVRQKVLAPILEGSNGITAAVVELEDDEADLGADRPRIRQRLYEILNKHEVAMLWEPYCTEAQFLGARYVQRSSYETSLGDLGLPPIYSALVVSRAMINANPTLPLRLRRALDRAMARLRDEGRLSFCANSLNIRGLLAGHNEAVRSSVLSRLAASAPSPADDGWPAVINEWARGLFAAIRLRQILIQNQADLSRGLGGSPPSYSSSNDCRRHIFHEQAGI